MFSKSTFSTAEYTLGYIHSHTNLCNMDSFRFPSVFNTVCLGKGPIVSIHKLLNHEYNRAYYMLLMAQIKQVTEVESLNGGPYVDWTSLNIIIRIHCIPKNRLDIIQMSICLSKKNFL